MSENFPEFCDSRQLICTKKEPERWVIIMFREAKALVNDHTYVAKNNFQMLSGSSYFRRLSCAKNGKTYLKRRIKIGRTTIPQALVITNNHDVYPPILALTDATSPTSMELFDVYETL